MAWPKPIEFYVLSCGSFWKPACNVVETAQRKSQGRLRAPLALRLFPAVVNLLSDFDSKSVIVLTRRFRLYMLGEWSRTTKAGE
jgi:hypothetical protein